MRGGAYFGRAGDGRNLRVDVRGFGVFIHHQFAGVVEQRLTVDGVLHLCYLLQVTQFKAFHLNTSSIMKIQP